MRQTTVDVAAGDGDDGDDEDDGTDDDDDSTDDDDDSASPHPPPEWSRKRYCATASHHHPPPAGFSEAPAHTNDSGRASRMRSADINRATGTTCSIFSHFERSHARDSRSVGTKTTPCPHMTIIVCSHLFGKALRCVNAECGSTFDEVELIRLRRNRRPPQMHESTDAHGSAARASRTGPLAIVNQPLNCPRRLPHASWWHPPLMAVTNLSVPSGTGSMQPHPARLWPAQQRRLSRATE